MIDHFPPDGPVRQYKPLIIKKARECSQKYYLRIWDVIPAAVEIALEALKTFDPKRGTFGTHLEWRLKRLNRWGARQYRIERAIAGIVPESKLEGWELEQARREAKKESENNRRRAVCWSGAGSYSAWKQSQDPQALAQLARRLRPRVKNEKHRAVLAWMIGDLSGRENRTMMQAAADIGITKGYASKVVYRLVCQITLITFS